MRLISTLFMLLSCSCVAQDRGMTEAELLARYEEIFELRIEKIDIEGELLNSYVAQIPDSIAAEPFSCLPQDAVRYVQYLLSHIPDFLDDWMENSERGEKYPYELLRKDESFKREFYPVIGRCLERGGFQQNFTDLKQRTVTADTVLFTAARFIYPKWGEPVRGKCTPLRIYTCTGINGWMSVKNGRDLSLEAFAFAAMIAKSYDELSDTCSEEMLEKLNNLRRHGQDHDWIRSELWEFLAANECFVRAIRTRYTQMRDILPFTVAEWQPE